MAAAQSDLDTESLRSYFTGEWAQECGARVRARRKAFGWNQQQLATRVGVRTTAISKIENGDIVPRDYRRFALADVLKCNVQDLYPWPSRKLLASYAAPEMVA